jgi:uncharacterized membrane protein
MPDTGKSALGLDANITAPLGYIIWIVALVVVIMEKENKFVRFHAIQSLLYHAAAIIVFIGLVILLTILTVMLAFARLGELSSILWLLYMIVFVGYVAGLIFAAVKSYGGAYFKLPIVGNMAEKFANK